LTAGSSAADRGQAEAKMFEAEAEAEAEAKASRPRPKFWPRGGGHFGFEDFTFLVLGTHNIKIWRL